VQTIAVRQLDVSVGWWPVPIGGLRIAHVSDLHLRRWNPLLAQTQELLLGLEYDLLVVTGDFCDHPKNWRRSADLARRLFAPVRAPCGQFAILGNHDHAELGRLTDLNLTFLHNESTAVAYGSQSLAIAGVDQSFGRSGDIEAALSGVARNRPVVLLAHYPSTAYEAPPERVALVLAGHTHGGQIRLPLLGCVWTQDRIPRRMARGLHRAGQVPLHVSPGIGVSGPIPMRLRCAPEIAVLRLTLAPADKRRPAGDLREVRDDLEAGHYGRKAIQAELGRSTAPKAGACHPSTARRAEAAPTGAAGRRMTHRETADASVPR